MNTFGIYLTYDDEKCVVSTFKDRESCKQCTCIEIDGLGALVILGDIFYSNTSLFSKYKLNGTEKPDKNKIAKVILQHLVAGDIDDVVGLKGEFLIVAYYDNKCIVIRDFNGSFPVFYVKTQNAIHLSTSIEFLLKYISGSFSLQFIKSYLISSNFREEIGEDYTIYNDVQRIPPYSSTEISKKHNNITINIKKKHLEDLINCSHSIEDDYFFNSLKDSIVDRLSSTTAIQLSGGMDSSSVAAISNLIKKLQNNNIKLFTISGVYTTSNTLRREQLFIEDFNKCYPNIENIKLNLDNFLDFEIIKLKYVPCEPFPKLIRINIFSEFAKIAARNNSQNLLTGNGADEVIESLPWSMLSLLKNFKFKTILSDSKMWAKTLGVSTPHIISNYLLLPIANMILYSVLGDRFINRPIHETSRHLPSWFTDSYKEFAHKELYRNRAIKFKELSSYSSIHAIANIENLQSDHLKWLLQDEHNVNITHPFLDLRVIAACLEIKRNSTNAPPHTKYILQKSMRDFLPQSILLRKYKSHYNEVFVHGLITNKKNILNLAKKYSDVTSKILNQKDLLEYIDNYELNAFSQKWHSYLIQYVSLLIWLHYKDKIRPEANTASDVKISCFHSNISIY